MTGTKGIEGFITDVSERVEAARDLEERVAERTAELRAARDAREQQLERISTLSSITSRLLAAPDLEAVLSVVINAARRLSGTSGVMVGLINSERQSLSAVAAEGGPG